MPKTIIQIGTYTGDSENEAVLKSINSNDNAILIEPIPYIFEKLKENCNKKYPNNNFKFINKAISSKSGFFEIYTPSINNDFRKFPNWAKQISSFNKEHIENHIPELIIEKIIVETTTINEILKEYNISTIDLLQIDTEGHDYEIIMNYDFKIKPKVIQYEHCHTDGVYKTGVKNDEIIEYLKQNGYKVVCPGNMNYSIVIDNIEIISGPQDTTFMLNEFSSKEI